MLPRLYNIDEEYKINISKKVANELFNKHYINPEYEEKVIKELEILCHETNRKEHSMKRTLALISNPKDNSIYDMNTELKFITERNIEILLNQLLILSKNENLRFSQLVEVMNSHMHLILFGCSIEIGICTDVTSKSIEFFGDSNYHRKLERGESNCFVALDRKQIILEAISKSKYQNPLMKFVEGDSVVYVPMLGSCSSQGIIEIYGLQTITSSDHTIFERNSQILKGMMEAKDYRFVNTLRLWKLPPTSPTILEDGETSKFYGVNAFLVAGFCTTISFAKKGIPYFGGPRYTITWENGEKDVDIPASELLKFYRQTPQSLGCSSYLDDYLSEKLLEIANNAGCILEKQRAKSFLFELHQKISINNLKALRITEICIQSLVTMIHGIKELSFIGYNSNEELCFNTLVQFMKTSKHINSNIEEVYNFNSYDIIQLLFNKNNSNNNTKQKYLSKNVIDTDNIFIQHDNNNSEWYIIEVTVPNDFIWSKKLTCEKYFLVLHRVKLLTTNILDILTFKNVIKEMENAISCAWINELRKRIRKRILQEFELQLSNIKDITPNEICYNAIQSISNVLVGANIYIGLLEPGGNTLNYIVSNNQSKMEGKKLHRGEGVSFDVINDLKTIILRPEDLNKGKVLFEGTNVQVYYGKKLYKAKIHKVRGHEKYDIWYACDQKVEAGVDASRIVPENFAFRLKIFGRTEYPFVCIAIRHKNKAIGVLGIDTLTNVPKSNNNIEHPDPDLLQFLENLSKTIGTDIDIVRKKMSLQVLYNLSKNQFAELKDIMEAVYDILIKTMQRVKGMIATNICYEDYIDMKQRGLSVILKCGDVSNDIINSMKKFNPIKSNLKPIQRFGDKIVWILCKLRPAVRGEQGKIFIICFVSDVSLKDPDYEFLSNLHKLVSGTLQTNISHKAVTEMRYEALKEIKLLSQIPINISRQNYFNQVVENVQACFYSANMYVATLSQYNKTLEYVLASSQSDMLGKTLSRSDKHGVSFDIIDNISPIAISSTSKEAFRLFHFGPRHQFEYPFIGIPLVAHIDAVIGLLGIDRCDDPSSSAAESLRDTVTFFTAVGSSLSRAICSFKEEDAKNRLEQISREINTYNEGIREIKKVILEISPFAKRVLEIVYEPHDVSLSLTDTGSSMPKMTTTQDDFIVILQILHATCVPFIQHAMLKCHYMENEMLCMDIKPDGQVHMKYPIKIHISKGMNIDKIQIQFTLIGSYETFSRNEISQKSIGMTYLYNTPLYTMEHYLDSYNFSNVRVGRFQIMTKLLQRTDIVGFYITDIQLKGIDKAFEYVQSKKTVVLTEHSSSIDTHSSKDSSVINVLNQSLVNASKLGNVVALIKWNNNIITKSSSLPPKSGLLWSNLNVYAKLDSNILDENSILIDIWDTKLNGDLSNAYCRLVLSGTALLEYFTNGSTWLKVNEITDNRNEAISVIPNVVIKLVGETVTADNMTDYHMLEEFNRGVKVKIDSKSNDINDNINNEILMQTCELGILCARDLYFNMNTLVIIYFNGEEVGRTSLITENANPIWNEEYFHIQVPASDALEECVLQLELNHLDIPTNKEEIIGCVSITGKQLTNFIANTKLKYQWFDIVESEFVPSSTMATQGELKLSGRPLQVNVTGFEADAIEMGIIELNLLSISNLMLLDTNYPNDKINSYAMVYFNGRNIYRTKSLEGHSGGMFNQEKVIFRIPNNKSLFQSILKIEIWHDCSQESVISLDSNLETFQSIQVAFLELTGSILGKFIGQNGIITKRFALKYIDNKEHIVSTNVVIIPEIELRGGPINQKEIYEDEGNEIYLDILAATCFPFHQDHSRNLSITNIDYRPNIYCEVTWNSVKVGRTTTMHATINPIWEKQRFVLKVPVIPHYIDLQDSVLQFCNLRLDFYDEINENASNNLIGYLILNKKDIVDLFENSGAYVKWFSIQTDNESLKNPIISHQSNSNHQCKVKLRGGFAGINESKQNLSNEYILQIHSARELSNTDIFGGADSYVIVEWCGEDIGHTQTISKSIHPKFNQEVFILREDSIIDIDFYSLSLQVWSKQMNSNHSVFLGRVYLQKEDLLHLLKENHLNKSMEYILTTSPDFTSDENQLVKGFITLSCMKLIDFPQNIEIKKEAILWIVSASNLPSSNAFGIISDVFCKVFRKYTREGFDFIEIYRTNIIYKTLNPMFSKELVPILIPAYEDWTGFEIRIEIWDLSQELLGFIQLSHHEAYKLLTQSDQDMIINPITLSLTSNSIKQTSSSITIAGGFKIPFEHHWSVSHHTKDIEIIESIAIKEPIINQSAKNDMVNNELAYISIFNVISETKSDFDSFPTRYCVVKWDNTILGTTSMIESEWINNKFEFKLNKNLDFKSLSIEMYTNSIKDDGEDLLIGSLLLNNPKDLKDIFDPSLEPLSFPLNFTTSALLLRKLNIWKIKIKGNIPKLQKEYLELHTDFIIDEANILEDINAHNNINNNDSKETFELEEMDIEIQVIGAIGLAQVNKIGKSNDAFAIFYWNHQKEPIYKTDAVSNTLNPRYDSEIFIIKKKHGISLYECELRVVLYHKNLLTSPTFLGECIITGDVWKEWIGLESMKQFSLNKSNIDKTKQNYVQGKIEMSAVILPIYKEYSIFNYDLPYNSTDLAEIEMNILAASGLTNINGNGQCDSYCKVQWGRTDLGTTSAITSMLNPIWVDNKEFILRIPRSWITNKLQENQEIDNTQSIISDRFNHLLKYMILSISVYTRDKHGIEIFLGLVEIIPEQLQNYINSVYFHRQWFSLQKTNRLKSISQKHVQGEIQLLFSLKHSEKTNELVNNKLEIVICSAQDLILSTKNKYFETFINYRWNGKYIGRTYQIENSLDPVWEDEKLTVKIPRYMRLEDCLLELEVWQNTSDVKILSIGVVSITKDVLKNLVEDSNFTPQCFPLGLSSSDTISEKLLAPKIIELVSQQHSALPVMLDLGKLDIRCGFAQRMMDDLDSLVTYEVQIHSAINIGIVDTTMQSSDPFAICKWNGREIGRTSHILNTVNPIWTNQKFTFSIDPEADISLNLLQIDLWNFKLKKKGEFLGCIYLSGKKLSDVFTQLLKSGRLLLDLEKSPLLSEQRQHLVQGQIEISIQLCSKSDSNHTLDNNMKWMEARDRNAGIPIFKFSLLSIQDLPTILIPTSSSVQKQPTSTSTRFLSSMKELISTSSPVVDSIVPTGVLIPSCTVTWMDEIVYETLPMKCNEKNVIQWSDNDILYLKIPTNIDSNRTKSILLLEIWDYSSGKKGAFLGKIEFSFASLIRLYTGQYSFLLRDNKNKPSNNIGSIRGSLSFSIDFVFVFWNSMRSVIPKVYQRKLSIFAGNHLPLINHNLPSTKCVIFFDGVIKAKTIVIPYNASPVWPQIDLDIIVDTTKSMEIMIIIYHVNSIDKKEVIIGQELLPSEHLFQPPLNKFDLFLGPSLKKPSPAFKFTTSGSVSIQITGSNSLSKAMLPYSCRLIKPIEAITAKDVRGIGRKQLSKLDNILSGDTISLEDRLWLGTAYDFSSSQIISSKPNWIVMPLQDIGVKMGVRKSDVIGTIPGYKFALCIEREENKMNVSDPFILNEITSAVSSCLSRLRTKDIYRSLREKVLRNFTNELKDFVASHIDIKHEDINDDEIFLGIAKLLESNLNICFPDTIVRIAKFTPDFNAINYYYNLSSSRENKCITLYKHQGCDWEVMGRTLNKSFIIKSYSDIKDKIISIFTLFPLQRFPRITIPLKSDDAALGFYQIENFDYYLGGLHNKKGLYDENEIIQWLEILGEMCGDVIYKSKEDYVLEKVLKYSQLWNSNIYKLLSNVIKDSFQVLQGCKMMEILEIDSLKNITSLIESKPVSTDIIGSEVILDMLCFTIHSSDPLQNLDTDIEHSRKNKSENSLYHDNKEDLIDSDSLYSDTLMHESTSTTLDQQEEVNQIEILVGIRYDAIEQIQVAQYDWSSNTYSIPKTHIILGIDRIIYISVYHISKNDLSIVAEYTGRATFITFEEKELKFTLSLPVPSECTITNPIKYDGYTCLIWPKKYEFVSKSNEKINGFTLKIKRARELLAADSGGTSDPFCEIIYHNKIIFQTQIIKKSLSPVWDESFIIPYTGIPSSLVIEVYDMNFMRKGAFLGKIEILHDHLLHGRTGQEIEYPLQINEKKNIKKQTKVGGMLTVEYGSINNTNQQLHDKRIDDLTQYTEEDNIDVIDKIDEKQVGNTKQSKNKKNIKSNSSKVLLPSTTIPKEIFKMNNPTIEITIKSAYELNKANLFGGNSDPFAVIYINDNEDPIAKTNVINNTTNPKWNETFCISLGTDINKDKSNLDDFPTIKLEVLNYSNFKSITSLGYCKIPASWYFSKNNTNGDFKLKSIIENNEKNKNNMKGNIQFSIRIIDNVLNIRKQSFMYSPSRYLQPLIYLEIHILKAKNLMVANLMGGKSDPYIIIRWNNKICGETTTKKNTLNPQWNNEKFLLCLSEAQYNIGSISLEVWDKDFFRQGAFMGEVYLNSDVILHPPSGSIELALQPKESVESTSKANKISGSIIIKLIKRYVLQKPKFEQLNVVILDEIPPQLDIIKVNMIYDPVEELRRQQKEGSHFPQILEKTNNEMDKYLKNPFTRTGFISELHYGQLLSALQRADHTILKSDLVDTMCYPTFEKYKKISIDSNEQENHMNMLFLTARYNSNKVPKRDLSFMQKLHHSICQGISIINAREERMKNFKLLKENLELLSNATENTTGIIVQSLLDFELTMHCKTNLYLLNMDGTTFNECSTTTGEIQVDKPPADEMIHLFARICRYNVIIQKYHGEYSIVDADWDSFSQPSLPSLDLVKSKFEDLEGPTVLNKLISMCNETRKDGIIIAPLIAYNEVLLGLLVFSTVDRYPSVDYRIHTTIDSIDATKNTAKNPFTIIRKLEHGIMNSIKDTCKLFANAILTSRINTTYKRIKSFPIQIDTDILKIIRYIFRLVVTDIPAIRNISIWAINCHRNPILKDPINKPNDNKNVKSKTSFTKGLFTTTRTKIINNKQQQHDDDDNDDDDDDSDLEDDNNNTLETSIPIILAGYFGAEDPAYLLNTKIERGVQVGMKVNNSSNTNKNDLQAISHIQDIYNDNLAKWKINTPITLQSNYESIGKLTTQLSNHSSIQSDIDSLVDNGLELTNIQSTCFSEVNKDLMSLIYSEVYRCTNILKIKTFSTINGHILSQIGTSKASKPLIESLFLPEIERIENINNMNIHQKDVNNISTNDKKDKQNHINSINTTMNKQLDANKTLSNNNANYQYFLTISTYGIGNNNGWGSANEEIEKIMNHLAELIDNNLIKLNELKKKI